MRKTGGAFLALVVFLLPAFTVAAEAKQKPITLNLPKQFTVVALAINGTAASTSGSGNLTLTPPAKKVTLHLIGSNGKYFGPIVVGKQGGKATVGVKAGSSLGKLKLCDDYATSATATKVDRSLVAKASKLGKPIGAGKLGLVKTDNRGKPGEGRDPDHDGLPGAFDIDDDGDGIIDNVDEQHPANPTPPQQPNKPGQSQPGNPNQGKPNPVDGSKSFNVFSNLKLDLAHTVNANVGPAGEAQIDPTLAANQTLAIQIVQGERVSLNCNGLTYCSLGGTGRNLSASNSNFGTAPPFPDPNNLDGQFGILQAGPTGDFQLLTGATTKTINAGDTYIENVTSGGQTTQVPGVLNFYLVSTPAVTQVESGSVSTTITYPTKGGDPGDASNPIQVTKDGDAVVKLEFWRPQREPVPGAGEGSGYIDVGQLKYMIDIPNAPGAPGTYGNPGPGTCKSSAYTPIAPELRVSGDSVEDQAVDKPANPVNKLKLEVNLSKCLADRGLSWQSGQVLSLDVQARSRYGDNSAQKLYFKR